MRVAAALLAALAAAVVVELARWGWQQHARAAAARAVLVEVMSGPTRPLAARFSHPAMDRHRPLAATCPRPQRGPGHDQLAELEAAGEAQGLAAVHALACDVRRARRVLEQLPSSHAVENDLAALVNDDPGRREEALKRLDVILREAPQHPQALWNRGLILAGMGLPRAGARAFRAVAVLGEPGWAAEASARASELEARVNLQRQASEESSRAVSLVAQGQIPPDGLIARFPEAVRLKFYETARQRPAGTLESLLPLASAIDRVQGGRAMTLITTGRVNLQRLWELSVRPGVTNALLYQRLSAGTEDPLREIRGHQLLGWAEAAARNLPAAHAAYDKALELCRSGSFPATCIDIKLAMAIQHLEAYRLHDASELALSAKGDSDTHHLAEHALRAERLLQRLADFRQEFAMARAYAEELTLRSNDCLAVQSAREYLAEVALQLGQPSQALANLEAIPACASSAAKKARRPNLGRVGLNVLANLIREQGPAAHHWPWFEASVSALRGAGTNARRDDLMHANLFEGRALLLRSPVVARSKLEQAISLADSFGPADEGAQRYSNAGLYHPGDRCGDRRSPRAGADLPGQRPAGRPARPLCRGPVRREWPCQSPRAGGPGSQRRSREPGPRLRTCTGSAGTGDACPRRSWT